ncbi:MAG: hypothetical protein EOO88_46110 [Pedobacter sp.]|nr:MAG: hypothetical protein EOO88_46110 [Pedobacter sp.]
MDCKHLTTRYDTPNQKNDFNNFTQGSKKRKSYNETMSNKVTWFRQHLAILSSYVEKLTNGATTITGYKIEGIFLINTPTLYMYNSEFRIYCISDLKAVVEGTYLDKTFLVHIYGEDQVKMLKIEYPYFRKPSYAVIDPFLDD